MTLCSTCGSNSIVSVPSTTRQRRRSYLTSVVKSHGDVMSAATTANIILWIKPASDPPSISQSLLYLREAHWKSISTLHCRVKNATNASMEPANIRPTRKTKTDPYEHTPALLQLCHRSSSSAFCGMATSEKWEQRVLSEKSASCPLASISTLGGTQRQRMMRCTDWMVWSRTEDRVSTVATISPLSELRTGSTSKRSTIITAFLSAPVVLSERWSRPGVKTEEVVSCLMCSYTARCNIRVCILELDSITVSSDNVPSTDSSLTLRRIRRETQSPAFVQ